MVQVIEVDRVIIGTEDIDATVEQFERLGLSFGETLSFQVGEERLSARLEEHGIDILSPDDEGEIQRYLDEQGGGLYGLSVRVADVEAAREALAEEGVEPIQEYQEDSFAEYFYHPRDFGGVLLIVCEYDVPHSLEAHLDR